MSETSATILERAMIYIIPVLARSPILLLPIAAFAKGLSSTMAGNVYHKSYDLQSSTAKRPQLLDDGLASMYALAPLIAYGCLEAQTHILEPITERCLILGGEFFGE